MNANTPIAEQKRTEAALNAVAQIIQDGVMLNGYEQIVVRDAIIKALEQQATEQLIESLRD